MGRQYRLFAQHLRQGVRLVQCRGADDAEQQLERPALGDLTLPAGNPYSPFGAAATVSRLTDAYGPLVQNNTGLTAHFGTVFNGDIGRWRWSVTGL